MVVCLWQIATDVKTRFGGFFYGWIWPNTLTDVSFSPFPESTHHKGHKIW